MARNLQAQVRTGSRVEVEEQPRLVLVARPDVSRSRERARRAANVSWSDDVVDNEHLNRKKSKVCCIYHRPQEFGESSDEEVSDEETDSEAEEARGPRRCGHRPNAYERQPK